MLCVIFASGVPVKPFPLAYPNVPLTFPCNPAGQCHYAVLRQQAGQEGLLWQV